MYTRVQHFFFFCSRKCTALSRQDIDRWFYRPSPPFGRIRAINFRFSHRNKRLREKGQTEKQTKIVSSVCCAPFLLFDPAWRGTDGGMSHFNIACLRLRRYKKKKVWKRNQGGGHNSVWKNILTKAANTGSAKITQQCGIQDKKIPLSSFP